jgi:hypothetical protein
VTVRIIQESPDDYFYLRFPEGATFQVFAGVPEEYLDLHDDLPVFASADVVAGRTGVRVRVLAAANSGVAEQQVRRLAETAGVQRGSAFAQWR